MLDDDHIPSDWSTGPQPAAVPMAVRIRPPATNPTAQDAPQTTIVNSDDPWVDPIHDAATISALTHIDHVATVVNATSVSRCH